MMTLFLFLSHYLWANCEIASPLTQEEVSKILQRNCMGRCHTLSPIQYTGAELSQLTPELLLDKGKIKEVNQILSDDKFVDGLPQSQWQGFDFKNWNKVQAMFLLLRGEDVFDLTKIKDFNSCTNVVCLYNKTYGLEEDDILGHQAWFYFLKTFYHIGARDFGSKKINSQELFEKDLFPDFVRLAFALPTELTAIDAMMGHYRKQIKKKACGWYHNGYTYHKNCGLKERRFFKHFHHELAHAYDFSHEHLSRSQEWKKLSGWQKLKGEWTHAEGEFSRRYGGKNPVEDFAVSVEAYRFRGPWMKSQLPDKYQYLKKNVFQDREFVECL